MYELYEQLLPTKLYTKEKTQTPTDGEVLCRLCGKVAESVAHVLAGCSSLAQTKYLYRHNAALKILFFELLREHGLIEEVPPWYSPVMPKPAYQNTTSEAFWDIPIYAEHNEVRANRIDARLVSHERKEVCTIEMSCPWIESRAKKDEEKTLKYGPMVLGLKQRYNGYGVEQYNVIIDGFLHGRIPQRIPLLEYESFTNNCYLPRFATTGKPNSLVTDEKCRQCGESLENVQHILSGCSGMAQTKYLQRHNNAFKILFFEVLRSLDLITKGEPWFSQVTPKPLY